MWNCVPSHEIRRRPAVFEDLAFGDYSAIVQSKSEWDRFTDVFGRRRDSVVSKVRETNELRNVAFHFRRAITIDEFETLVETRKWLLLRVRIVGARRRTESS
jgi:hypothetical protein